MQDLDACAETRHNYSLAKITFKNINTAISGFLRQFSWLAHLELLKLELHWRLLTGWREDELNVFFKETFLAKSSVSCGSMASLYGK